MGPSGTFARGAPGRRLLDLTSILLVAGIALLLPGTTVRGTSAITPSAPPAVEAVSAPAGTTPAPAVPTDGLALGVSASPRSICAFDVDTCAADAPTARVTLTASAVSSGALAWPNVQVAFVVETTADDGVYDGSAGDPGEDSCAASTQVLCEESNGVPFFVTNAPAIASAIAAANPDSQVTFAMVDYFANINNWDDGDGGEYHVGIPTFVSPSYFGSDVTSTFQATVLEGGFVYGDSDMADNQLTSSMITAMYGTIVGSGLDWSNNTHHVIVWMGSTAPRDPNYPEDYCVSWEDQYYASENGCIGATCEPSYTFTSGTSPNCEGWVRSQDGTATHSIASLAHTATQCTQSVGGDCTIDMIDLYDSNTDPLSPSWPAGDPGGGPGGILVEQDVDQTLLAGCDMAAATGGTWDGPAWFSCPDGSAGHLEYVPHGPAESPNTENPTLFAAFRDIGFGPVAEAQEAADAQRPLFEYVPFGPIVPTPDLGATAACVRAGVELPTCQQAPTVLYSEGRAYPRLELEREPELEHPASRRLLDGVVRCHGDRTALRDGPRRRLHDGRLRGGRERSGRGSVLLGGVRSVRERYRRDAVVPVGSGAGRSDLVGGPALYRAAVPARGPVGADPGPRHAPARALQRSQPRPQRRNGRRLPASGRGRLPRGGVHARRASEPADCAPGPGAGRRGAVAAGTEGWRGDPPRVRTTLVGAGSAAPHRVQFEPALRGAPGGSVTRAERPRHAVPARQTSARSRCPIVQVHPNPAVPERNALDLQPEALLEPLFGPQRDPAVGGHDAMPR